MNDEFGKMTPKDIMIKMNESIGLAHERIVKLDEIRVNDRQEVIGIFNQLSNNIDEDLKSSMQSADKLGDKIVNIENVLSLMFGVKIQ